MKVVILAGGYGTRLMEETQITPKPMVKIGERPILWHIMKLYSSYGLTDFIICLGYKGYLIKEYFSNYFLHTNDVTLDLENNKITYHHQKTEAWTITLVDTGEQSMTGGRLKYIEPYLDGEDFCLTYGDGLADVNLAELIAFHHDHGCLATLTSVQPPGRFGSLQLEGDQVMAFEEKPSGDGAWINGGFFVLSPKVLDYIEGDTTIWEKQPMETLASTRQLKSYFHRGFWLAMDTLRDKHKLEELWHSGNAPWKTW